MVQKFVGSVGFAPDILPGLKHLGFLLRGFARKEKITN